MENRDDIIANLLLRWEESFEHGDDVPAKELCQAHPELFDEVQSKIEDLKKMSWMTRDDDLGVEQPDELLSQTLGDRYRIESLIAAGGFGKVYRAFDPELERHVAVKVPHRQESNGQVDALVEEARRVAKLRHPGIVSVHDVGREDGTYFIVSELIDGKNLSEVIADQRPSVKGAVLLVANIAENLEAAHKAGFVHRDIKPANILIDENGKPLITDFGIASTHLDEETATKGTLPYMAPEQIANEKQLIDHRADIYSLGVVLYELLTGESPYSARTPGTLREQILFRSPKPIPDSVLSAVQEVCLKSLSKHPADRFNSADEFASALRHSLTTFPTKNSKRYKWFALFVTGVLMAAGGFLAGQFFDDEDHSVVQNAFEGGITFDGTRRIVTPIMNTDAPLTIEVWVAPSTNDNSESQFVVGSDVPGHYGMGLGMGANGHPMVEIIRSGLDATRYRLPTNRWSHLAAVFSFDETRLYLDGKLIGTCLPTAKAEVESPFVVGNLGFDHGKMCFLGKLRSVRITSGERFNEEFLPDENLSIGDNSESLLIYDESSFGSKQIEDLSGNGNHGNWDSVVVIE
ncbi:protein kinase domain-containing protein [Rubripirellula reticaptiva]|uniref:Serine/threonine-protein kinase PknH n=1 Tax=Rubripirellula reticaptiva TaxID=2528013 RepID=A0A5C6ELC3_9BACT|nr:protein kinase [Rubripirellula reticaptiva]TWU49255.1 Serine/threonine-protein kinase PknH [Rubripirellula reticaptiva]